MTRLYNKIHLKEREAERQVKFGDIWANELEPLFDDLALDYDDINDFFSFGFWTRIQRAFIECVDLPDRAEVLDVCAGTNAVGIDLLRKNGSVRVTALDRNKEMQKTGARLAAERKVQIQSVIADAHALPFPANSFDVVTLKAASRHLEIGKVLLEIKRVLKPGGYFYHCDLTKPHNPILAAVYYNYLRLMFPITGFIFFRRKEFLGRRERIFRFANYFIEAIKRFYTIDELSLIFKQAGLENVRAKSLYLGTVAVHAAEKD